MRSSGETDSTGGRRVVAAEFRRPLLQPFLPEETDQRLHRRPEIAALPHQQIEILPEQRDEIESRRFRRGAGGDAAVGLAGAGNIAAANAASRDILLANISSPPVTTGRIGQAA